MAFEKKARVHVACFAACIFVLTFCSACHPEGLYGPTAFNYNTKGVNSTNLVGLYHFDEASMGVLQKKLGYTNVVGSIELKDDASFEFVRIPCVFGLGKQEYVSVKGKWRIVKENAIWALEVYGYDSMKMCGFIGLTFPVLGEVPPHGLELKIDHDEGYYIRMQKGQTTQTN